MTILYEYINFWAQCQDVDINPKTDTRIEEGNLALLDFALYNAANDERPDYVRVAMAREMGLAYILATYSNVSYNGSAQRFLRQFRLG